MIGGDFLGGLFGSLKRLNQADCLGRAQRVAFTDCKQNKYVVIEAHKMREAEQLTTYH